MTEPDRPVASAALEIRERLWAERAREPFLIWRDGAGRQVIRLLDGTDGDLTVGRRPDNDVALTWDGEVSRVHARFERVGGEWTVLDDGLSRNGTFVNGERLLGRRRLRDGDRVVAGETAVVFRAPDRGTFGSTRSVADDRAAIPVTPAQRSVLVALCRPMQDSAYAAPASNRAIADELCVSVDAVKAHLRVLFERFGLDDLPQNQKRAGLAARALVDRIVAERDF